MERFQTKVWPMYYVFDIKVVLWELKRNQFLQVSKREANCLSVQIVWLESLVTGAVSNEI